MASIWDELKRRNVTKVAAAYAIVGWLMVEISSTLLPAFGAPDWVLRVVILFIGLGFIVALLFSWAYQFTPQGLVRDDDVPQSTDVTKFTNRWLYSAVAVALFVAAGFFIFEYAVDDYRWAQTDSSKTPVVERSRQESSAKSIAVLAFKDLSPEGDQEYFSDGISEELLNLLAGVDGLKVTSRTSSFSYKGTGTDLRTIAGELGVSHILEGSVRKAGSQIRITAQLIEAATDTHLWSQNFTRELVNVFDIQDEIAATVVDILKIELLGNPSVGAQSRRTDSPEAYDDYLIGRHHLIFRRTEDLAIARDYFRSAIEIDPSFAAPYIGLADSYIVQHMYGVLLRDDLIKNAGPAIEHALKLDPDMGQAYTSRAWLNWQKGDWAAAEDDFRQGISLSPNYATAYHWYSVFQFLAQHRSNEAIATMESALALDPLSPIINENAGRSHIWNGDFDRGLYYFRRANELIPRFPNFYEDIGELEAVNGRWVEAHRLYRKARSLDTGNPYLAYNLAYSYLVLGDLVLAQRWFDESAALFGEKPAAQLMHEYLSLVVNDENPERLSSITAQVDDWDIVAWIYFRPLGRAHLAGDDIAASESFYERFFPELFANSETEVNIFNVNAAIDVAWILRNEGDIDQANSLLSQSLALTRGDQAIGLADRFLPEVRTLSMLGQVSEALAALRHAIDNGWREAWWLNKSDPTLESIADHPEFIAMVDEIEADLAEQLERVRELGHSGEIAPLPEIVETRR